MNPPKAGASPGAKPPNTLNEDGVLEERSFGGRSPPLPLKTNKLFGNDPCILRRVINMRHTMKLCDVVCDN